MDTGSTFTALPRALLEELAVPADRRANYRTASGRKVTVDVGWTLVRLQEQTFPTRVIFAEDGEPSLLGMVTPGEALPAVDPVAQRLIPVDADRLRRSGTWTDHQPGDDLPGGPPERKQGRLSAPGVSVAVAPLFPSSGKAPRGSMSYGYTPSRRARVKYPRRYKPTSSENCHIRQASPHRFPGAARDILPTTNCHPRL